MRAMHSWKRIRLVPTFSCSFTAQFVLPGLISGLSGLVLHRPCRDPWLASSLIRILFGPLLPHLTCATCSGRAPPFRSSSSNPFFIPHWRLCVRLRAGRHEFCARCGFLPTFTLQTLFAMVGLSSVISIVPFLSCTFKFSDNSPGIYHNKTVPMSASAVVPTPCQLDFLRRCTSTRLSDFCWVEATLFRVFDFSVSGRLALSC